MKAKTLLAVILLGLSVFQACQNTNNSTKEAQQAAIDSAMEDHVITDTTALNRGADMSVFMNEAALGGMKEIELGKIAEKKSTNRLVRSFATTVVKDHGKIAERLKKLAESKRMTLPSRLPQADMAHIEEMKNMPANEFDKHYIRMMVTEHIKALDLFKSATTSGDTPLQNFAIRALRTLEAHYKTATELSEKLR